jgi:hypothetical protein
MQRQPNEPNPQIAQSSSEISSLIDEEIEIYYLGNETHPNTIEPGYICSASHFRMTWKGVTPSSILGYVAREFGGGNFQIVRVLDGTAVSERTIHVPGPTKDDVLMTREIALDS